MTDLTCQRSRFSIPEDEHFFNCAYLGPMSRAVELAGLAGMREKRMPGNFPSQRFFEQSEILRARFAEMIGGDGSRVAIIPSVSYGIAIAARNLDVAPNQNIVVLGEQFPSNYYAWQRLAERSGATLRVVARPGRPGPVAGPWNERLLESIDADTAVVALPNVHWTDGTRFDLVAAGEVARSHGAALVVDGSQSVGALPFDLQRIRPDALVCTGYKWLLGPYSMCLAWLGERFDGGEPLEETWIAREASDDFQRLVDYVDAYQPGAVRYDVGERSNFILVPMMIAALEQLLEWRPARIQAYLEALTADLVHDLIESGHEVESAPGRAHHILGIRLRAGVRGEELQASLAGARVYASLRGDALRVSSNVYNHEEDVAALRRVLLPLSS